MALRRIKRWAVHKSGTEQLGYLCSFKSEAEELLADMRKNILSMPKAQIDRYKVIEVEVTWDEPGTDAV